MSSSPRTLVELSTALASGDLTSRELTEQCIERVMATGGEGARTFLKVHREQALTIAANCDAARRRGAALPAYAGIPISVKDLFDIAGDTTTAGSLVLRDAAPAQSDAASVARLKAAGFIVIGRTNMTEFAYSGLGVNPHYGTPRNPWGRAMRRIPGGSSSGAAVSITDGMAFGALGTDTGGSCRIPAAFCGIVGFKPTAARVPMGGAFPLSASLDSIGPLANSVSCCTLLDAVLAGEPVPTARTPKIADLRLGVLRSYVMDGIAAEVATAYEHALHRLAGAGARLSDVTLPELAELPEINRKGGFAAAESYPLHRKLLAQRAAQYDPRVLSRILRGREQSTADHAELKSRRALLIDRITPQVAAFDALLMPTVPILAPTLAELETDEAYYRLNALVLRNPTVVNMLDGCAISIPCQQPGAPPVGLSLFGLRHQDRRLLAVAAAAEECLR